MTADGEADSEVRRVRKEGVVGDEAKAAANLPRVEVQPTLSAYYASNAPRLADWIKAVRSKASREFAPSDIDDALAGLAEKDPSLRRTFALMDSSSSVASIRRWVQIATRQALKDKFPDMSIDPTAPASEQIGRIAAKFSPQLRSKDKIQKVVAENLFRLGLHLVLNRREYDPADVLASLFQPLGNRADLDARPTITEFRKRLETVGMTQLRDLCFVQAYSVDRITNAEWARRDAQDRAYALQEELRIEKERVAGLKADIAANEDRMQFLADEVARLKQAIEDTQQIGAHGTAGFVARYRSFLSGRLGPLCSDAADALDDPPILEVAKDRIGSVRRAINTEVSWLDESSG